MGYDLQKRLADLRRKVESDVAGRLGFWKALFLSLLLLFVVSSLLSTSPESDEQTGASSTINEKLRSASEDKRTSRASWKKKLSDDVSSRMAWLESSPFGDGASDSYYSFAQSVVRSMSGLASADADEDALIDISGIRAGFARSLISAILRIGFIFVSFWPLWLVASILGAIAARTIFVPKRTPDILGICTPGNGPFYSGIYGPFRPNRSLSGTDYSCPGLAIPSRVKKSVAMSHPIVRALRRFSALNETNLELAQIILAYSDYPSHVDDERVEEDDSGTIDILSDEEEIEAAQTHFDGGAVLTNEGGTIEKSSVEGLLGILEAHSALQKYYSKNEKEPGQEGGMDATFEKSLRDLEPIVSATKSPLAGTLIKALTPLRGRAISTLSPATIATAYLSIEAGKVLTYDRISGGGFTPISRFPHLQARAVVQSIVSFHKEYNGDTRLILRQAIICSRRHGDFGRAFLPIKMPISSRGLRDWLEIMYTDPENRADTGLLTELDAHIDELRVNWCRQLSLRFRAEREAQEQNANADGFGLWKGVAYKSVVLMPLNFLVEISMKGVSPHRRKRILKLIDDTRKLQAIISISARLPGFKRQAEEASRTGADERSSTLAGLKSAATGEDLITDWIIIRRMLTRYNWLSTRVGDDSVPSDGLIQAVLINRSEEKPEALGLDTLIPLRQRRYWELFGEEWENTYYLNNPHPSDVEIFVEMEKFQKEFEAKLKRIEAGTLDKKSDDEDAISAA